jgi:peptidoglycan/LPS O-acetylase OafA/YrhL
MPPNLSGGSSEPLALSRRSPLPALTSLRFFAAMEVVIFHFFYFQQSDFLHSLMSGGRQAVTFFFVLSGFILTYVYSENDSQAGINVTNREFWRARFARIMPTYWLGLLIAFPVFAYSALISGMSPVREFLQGLLLCLPGVQAWWPPAALAWNPPAWSLSVEMFFYLLFPVLARAVSRLSVYQLLATILSLVVGASVLVEMIMPGPDMPSSAFNPILLNPVLHLPDFLLGMTVARAFLFNPPLSAISHLLLFIGASLAAIIIIGARASLPWWSSSNTVLAPLFGMTIFGAARMATPMKILVLPPLPLLGEASYALYILHSPLLFWWDWTQRKILMVTFPTVMSFILYCAGCIIASILTFLFFEKPLREKILGHSPHSDRLAPTDDLVR